MSILGTTFAALLNNLWQSAAIALLVWAALRFLPRFNVQINAATRCAVWWAVLAAVVLLPIAPQPGTRFVAPAPAASLSESLPESLSQSAAAPVPASAVPVTLTEIETPAKPSGVGGPLRITAGAGLIAIFAIWSALSLFRIAQIIRSYRYLRGIKQRSRAVSPEQMVNFDYWLLACGVDRTARLLVSSEIVSPMAVGFRRPAVIVPETLLNEFTPEELDHVLLHELAHIARYDDWTNLVARLIGALLPIHPVAVWLVKRIEQEREIACDDWVVAMTGEARPYAASLTRLFELCSARRRQLLATGMADRASHLGERIEALLRAGRDFAPRVSLVRAALGVAVLFGLVLAAAQAPHWVAFAQEPAVAQEPVAAPVSPPLPPVAPQAPVAPTAQLAQAAPVPQRPQAPQAAPVPPDMTEILSLETKLTLEARQLREMQQQLAEQSRTYTENHPAMLELERAIRDQEEQLQAQKMQMAAAIAQDRAQVQARQAQQEAQNRIDRGSNNSFLAALVAAGYGGISVDEIIELHGHGVTPEFLRALGQDRAATDKLSTKDLIVLAGSGVRPELFRALRQSFPQITAREIVEAAQAGLNAEDLRRAKEFSPNLTLPQIIRLKQAGVI